MPSDFWRQTPRQFVLAMRGYKRRAENSIDLALMAAWHVEAFARQKKLPKLSTILTSQAAPPTRRQQSGDEMIAALAALTSTPAPAAATGKGANGGRAG